MNGLRAMILAAGRGERLRPLTEAKPKPLVQVAGRCLIDYAIDACRNAGITDVIVNLHHLGDQIRDHLGDGSGCGVSISYSEEATLLGSGGGIREAKEMLGRSTFVTLNADTIIDIDLLPVLEAHRQTQAAATLVLRKDPEMEKFGLIKLESDHRIGAFLATQRADTAGSLEPYMYTGVQILEPEVFDFMPASGSFSITEVTYPQMLRADRPLFGYPFDGPWITVGTPEELEKAERRLATQD
jgi:mannose-1-phosphate guanylyltransferase